MIPTTYISPDLLPKYPFDTLSAQDFLDRAPWEQRTSARLEAFWSTLDQPYTYGQGRGQRTYHPSPFPQWMLPIKHAADRLGGRDMQLCFLNRYDDQHQHLGWHADDSPEQDDAAPIIVMSFGAAREIWVRENGKGGAENIHRQLLEDRSVFIMLPGMQQTHQHRIPKCDKPCGVRVSLTWRALKPADALDRLAADLAVSP